MVLAASGCASAVGPGDAGDAASVLDAVAHDGASDGASTHRVPRYHRASADPCPTDRPAGDCRTGGGPALACSVDGDCTMGTNGRCLGSRGGPAGCHCSYDTCRTDGDCMAGQLCACRGGEPPESNSNEANACLMAGCRVDADCGPDGYCSPSRSGGCGGVTGYYCHTTSDECIDDTDCVGTSVRCVFQMDARRWQCSTPLICP